MSTLDELKIDTDESQLNNKSGMKKIRSPGHILDDQLYVEWHENDNDISDGSLSKKSIQTHFEISKSKTSTIDCENGIFCVSYSPNEKYLAVGCQDGGIRVLTTKDGKLGYRLKTKGNLPVCSMKWRQSKDNGLTNTLVSVNSYGYINHWQIETQKSIHSIQEKNNHIFCLEYSPNGSRFATAGKDRKVRIYDDETKKVIYTMEKGYMEECPGHSNRIFGLKWKPQNNNIIVSGGWDDNVLFWDLRNGKVFRNIYGPHIAGPTIDIRNGLLLTGSWRNKDTIQLWEFNTGKLFKTIKWKPSPMVYSCSFHPKLNNIVCAAGTGVNSLTLINIDTNEKSNPTTLTNKNGIYCFDWNNNGNKIAFGGLCEDVSVIDININTA
mmetsp:Transcript_76906/g.94369  ORF Transcript_76906/g.94369 Transcript_76906/m.94369 type:complete len:380 (-) Transcript_76906:32-1171(-)